MKKFFFFLGVIAASAFVFSACQKEQSVKDEPSDKLVTVTFTAEKAGVETRTAAVVGETSVSYVWTDEDAANIKLFTVATEIQGEGNQQHEVEVLTEVTNAVATKVSDTKLTISASVAPGATYSFRAILCDPQSYTGSGDNYSTRKPKIKAVQNPDSYNNFDPTADLLVSDDMDVTVIDSGEETISTGDLEMVFRRKVVVNKMTLKNLTANEKVSKVVVTSIDTDNTAGDLTGYLEGSTMKGQSKSITLEYDNVAVPSDGQFPVYFISMSNTGIALKVDVTTDQYVYTKSFAEGKSIDLNLGQFTKFAVALPAGTPATAVANGQYFITGIKSSQVYAAKMYVSGNNLQTFPITLNATNETISYADGVEDCLFTLTRITEGTYAGKYTIQDVNDLYLYAAGGTGSEAKNHLKGEEEPDAEGNAYWTVSKNGDGTYDVQSAGNAASRIMRYNGTNNIFSCYSSGQTAITLYPASWCTIDTTPVLTIDESERTKNVGCNDPSVAFSYSANRYATGPVVTIVSDSNSIIDGDPIVSDGTITVALNPNSDSFAKVATLSVTSSGLASAVTLTINQAEYTETSTVRFTYTITTSDFSATGYGKPINDITATEVNGTRTVTVKHADSNAGHQSGNIQFKKSTGILYNTTDLGNVISVVLNGASHANSYTVYKGSSEQPTTAGEGGYFCIKETGGNTLTCTSITVVFEKEVSSSGGDNPGGDTPTGDGIEITFSSISGTGDSGNITVTAAQGEGVSAPAYTSDELRLYANNTLTVASANSNIVRIELLFHRRGDKPYIETVTANPGTYTSGGVSTSSSDTKTDVWTGSSKNIVFTMGSSGQRVLEKVIVYYN